MLVSSFIDINANFFIISQFVMYNIHIKNSQPNTLKFTLLFHFDLSNRIHDVMNNIQATRTLIVGILLKNM
jgi:hypothetical protein